jgi:ABC-type uncharacterized transport system permease subunit
MFWSHKVLRWFTPHQIACGLVLVIASVISGNWWPSWLLLLAYCLGLLAALGQLVRARPTRSARALRTVQYLLVMQLAIFAGFLRFLPRQSARPLGALDAHLSARRRNAVCAEPSDAKWSEWEPYHPAGGR